MHLRYYLVRALLFVGLILFQMPLLGQGPEPTGLEALRTGNMKELRLQPSGALLAWDHGRGKGVIFRDTDGLGKENVSGPSNIAPPAVSPSGHLAFVVDFDRSVLIRRDGGADRTIEVGEPLADVIWLDDRRLAIGLRNSDRLVEIWDAETGERLHRLIPTEPIDTSPGYRPVRVTRFAWDAARNRLHALDAFTGEYLVAQITGESAQVLHRGAIDDRHRQRYLDHIAQANERMIAREEFQPAAIWRFHVSRDSVGTAWMVERCEESTAHLLAVNPDNTVHRATVETACCSLQAVAWRDELAFLRPALGESPGCFETVKRPDLAPDDHAWLEVIPLSQRPGVRSRQGRYALPALHEIPVAPDASADLWPDFHPGLHLVCAGGQHRALDCSQQWLDPDATAPADLVPVPTVGRAVTGRVTVDDEPVADTSVALVPETLRTVRRFVLPLTLPPGAPTPEREVRTDDDGRFELPPLAPGRYRLVLALPNGRRDQGTVFEVGPPRRERDGTIAAVDLGGLDFASGLTVEVAITDASGQPIPAAWAGAAQQTGPAGSIEFDEFQAQTGADGMARLTGFAPTGQTAVSCSATGYSGTREEFESPPSFVPCTLVPLGRLTGRLVDPDGEPLPALRVELRGGSAWSASSVETATSDDDGRVAFTLPSEGTFEVVAAGPGREPVRRSLTVEPGESHDLGELILEPGTVWRVRVVDGATGEPVPGASVAPLDPRQAFRAATTDDEGAVEIEGPAHGDLRLEARAEGFAVRHVDLPEASRAPDAQEPHEIVLDPGGWIVARVWDEETGGPCVGCRVSLSGPGPADPLVTDASGAARSAPLAPGLWRAIPEWLRGLGSVVTRSGGDDTQLVTVDPRTTAEVRFGEPRETMEVVVSPAPGGSWRLHVQDTSGRATSHALDASGAATIPRPEGGALVSLVADGTNVDLGTVPEDAPDPVVLDPPAGRLTGVLPPEAGDGGGVWLELWSPATGHRIAGWWAAPGQRFAVPFLPTGSYELRSASGSLGAVTVIDGQETVFEPTAP
jgi:hypothetical protein